MVKAMVANKHFKANQEKSDTIGQIYVSQIIQDV